MSLLKVKINFGSGLCVHEEEGLTFVASLHREGLKFLVAAHRGEGLTLAACLLHLVQISADIFVRVVC